MKLYSYFFCVQLALALAVNTHQVHGASPQPKEATWEEKVAFTQAILDAAKKEGAITMHSIDLGQIHQASAQWLDQGGTQYLIKPEQRAALPSYLAYTGAEQGGFAWIYGLCLDGQFVHAPTRLMLYAVQDETLSDQERINVINSINCLCYANPNQLAEVITQCFSIIQNDTCNLKYGKDMDQEIKVSGFAQDQKDRLVSIFQHFKAEKTINEHFWIQAIEQLFPSPETLDTLDEEMFASMRPMIKRLVQGFEEEPGSIDAGVFTLPANYQVKLILKTRDKQALKSSHISLTTPLVCIVAVATAAAFFSRKSGKKPSASIQPSAKTSSNHVTDNDPNNDEEELVVSQT